ncbi:hypothetical protein Fmac_019117 [Flemingia macrophylla]|uniref:Uncharacterized protein n=1 Tax=Flemingia macrophylla TaxID=520843 RepID=A0ABD1M6Y0_9FABA
MKRKRKRERCLLYQVDELGPASVKFDLDKATIPRRFESKELVDATNGFWNDRRLGHGVSGQVYKGVLSYLRRVVAVKRISTDFEDSEKFEPVQNPVLSSSPRVLLTAMPHSPSMPTTLIRSSSQGIPTEPRRIVHAIAAAVYQDLNRAGLRFFLPTVPKEEDLLPDAAASNARYVDLGFKGDDKGNHSDSYSFKDVSKKIGMMGHYAILIKFYED